jgi:hypothetical protein
MTDQWKVVRQANSNGGPCELLGPLLEEQTTRLVYRCQTGLKAHIPKRLVHIEPCRSARASRTWRSNVGPNRILAAKHVDCGWWKAAL